MELEKANTRCSTQLEDGPHCGSPGSAPSRSLQSLLYGLGRAIDDQQVGASRSLRLTQSLLPMAQGIDAEAEPPRELLLCHTELRPDGLHVDGLGDMDAIRLGIRLALCIGHGLFEAMPDAVRHLAHLFLLLNASTRIPVRRLKSLRSCWLRSAHWFLA